ncbi:MAG: hypothetical protein ABW034_00940 [Steroidobacteraceae bacterium]
MPTPQQPEKTPKQPPRTEPAGEPVGLAEIGPESAENAGSDKIAIPLPIEENDSNAQPT